MPWDYRMRGGVGKLASKRNGVAPCYVLQILNAAGQRSIPSDREQVARLTEFEHSPENLAPLDRSADLLVRLRRASHSIERTRKPVQKISVFVREQINESVPVGHFNLRQRLRVHHVIVADDAVKPQDVRRHRIHFVISK
jgi:hypothetical protein